MRTAFSVSREAVTSADGTVIGYRRVGSGPPVLVLHGSMLAAQHMMRLAYALADDFTVTVPDRRGRGSSGPHGDAYRMAREIEDVAALAEATGASRVFGLSSGGLIALYAARTLPQLDRVAAYEPPLSVDGSVPIAWLDRFDREIAAGERGKALVTALKSMGVEPLFNRVPRPVLDLVMPLTVRLQRDAPAGDVTIEALTPTMHFDMALVRETADTADDLAHLDAQVLLLGGSRSPAYLGTALDALTSAIPGAQRRTLPGLGHSGPEDDGRPELVAEVLRDFFR
ncbi:MAG: alpha/beta hydrolase [Hamadaea sp.]|nr:alpha/beta hydrolase [Hamadaea sp.]NUR50182.1 alpha/beta hydrolase [Hamadaea sp.]NUT04887.1 alpha/beta hydrolase [Hamadaea sp.]